MNYARIPTLLLLFLTFSCSVFSQGRLNLSFNADWTFSGAGITGIPETKTLTLPHTWNDRDAQSGVQYYRGPGVYEKSWTPDPALAGKRLFIRFEGAMTVADVFLNGEKLGQHRGGYSAFCFEITDGIKMGQANTFRVELSNEPVDDVPPLVGDFNIYGGIYRPVSIIATDQICISPLDYASSGVYVSQQAVSEAEATVEVLTKLSIPEGSNAAFSVRTQILDATGALVLENTASPEADSKLEVRQPFRISSPTLWNGRESAYLYAVVVQVLQNGAVIDEVRQPMGLRYFKTDPNDGFFLNGKHIKLKGVSRHQDRIDIGSAILPEHHREDMALIEEMGTNSIRLAHYQHAEYFYQLCDTSGMVVWAEIPFVGFPRPVQGGYNNSPEFHANARQQLMELIRQNYNHPSILMWGLFNELPNSESMAPAEFIRELQTLAKSEDPYRLTTAASLLPEADEMHEITDLIAWNKYFGWYYKQPEYMATWLDETHASFPNYQIGISEYGAGGSIIQHSSKVKKPNPMGSPHPEEWQSYYHEVHWKAFAERPFVWGTYVWNMFDFGSQFRREGDTPGLNDKGLVTFDRKTKKDAFYFYKASWSEEPVLYIAERKFRIREDKETRVKVYSNLSEVELIVNGTSMGTRTGENSIFLWEDVELIEGNNVIEAKASTNGQSLTDACVWVVDGMGIGKIFELIATIPTTLYASLAATLLLFFPAYRRKKLAKGWKWLARLAFYVVLLVAVLLIAVAAYLNVQGLNVFEF